MIQPICMKMVWVMPVEKSRDGLRVLVLVRKDDESADVYEVTGDRWSLDLGDGVVLKVGSPRMDGGAWIEAGRRRWDFFRGCAEVWGIKRTEGIEVVDVGITDRDMDSGLAQMQMAV